MKYILVCIFGFLIFACDSSNSEIESEIEPTEMFTVKAIQNGQSDWGYEILRDKELFIKQPHIPAVSGNKGFSTKEKAIITGEYIIRKLEKGIMPPTITIAELDSLGVLQ